MKICCLSDIHGFLPDIPDCDLLLLGGDYCYDHDNYRWYNSDFSAWLRGIHDRGIMIVGVAGNHDFIFQRNPSKSPAKLPAWRYLQDTGFRWKDINIWGSPWQPTFFDWAFNADEPALEAVWSQIPAGTDILLLHGPPHGYGDLVISENRRTGSPSLTRKIIEVKPKLVVCGHIHCSRGVYYIPDQHTVIVNAAYVGEDYKPQAGNLYVLDWPISVEMVE